MPNVSMQGALHKYGPAASHLAFVSAPNRHRKHVALVGGLTDGFLFASYGPLLAEKLDEEGWSLVQVQVRQHQASGFLAVILN